MKIIDSITLGATIRARRKELGYTQSDLAEFTGFSISFISDLERGKKTAEIGKAFDEKRTRYFFEGLLPEGFTRKCLK